MNKYVSNDTLRYIDQLIFDTGNKVVEGIYSGRHKSLLIGKSLEFVQHREYTPSDDIKLIDWKVYARKDRFFIKQYQQETNIVVNIALDCSNSMWYPEKKDGELTKYEYASFLVSYLSYILLNQGDSVGVIKFGSEIKEKLGPSSKNSFYHDILNFLDRELKEEKTDFSKLFEYIISSVKKKTYLILISDLISKNEEHITKMLRQLSTYGIYVYVLHIIAPKERKIDFDYENCIFEDLENEFLPIKTNLQEIKEYYRDKFKKLIEYYNKNLNDNNIKYFEIDISLPIITNLKLIMEQK